MTNETYSDLCKNLRIGYTDERGPAWWWRGDNAEALASGSHFDGPVPPEVVRELMRVPLVRGRLFAQWEDADGNRQVRELDQRMVVMQQDTGDDMGVFGKDYVIHQYEPWTIGVLDQLARSAAGRDLDEADYGIAAAGLLEKAKVAFVQARLSGDFEFAGYGYQPYMMALTSSSGRLASDVSGGVIGAVCDNTMEMARRSAAFNHRVKHTLHSEQRRDDMQFEVGLMYKMAEDFEASSSRLLNVDVSDEDFRLWKAEMLAPREEPTTKLGRDRLAKSTEERSDEMDRLWTKDPKVAPWTGTAFGIVQLDNTDRTWNRQVRGGTRLERNLMGAVNGTTGKEDQRALDVLAKVQGRKLVLA